MSNSLYSTDNRLGVPNVFVRRSTMEAATLEEARRRGLPAARARGTNQFFADTAGRLWDIESSATASAFADHAARGYMAHTNHYVAAEMAPFEGSDRTRSRARGCAPPRPCSPPGSTTARSRSISWPVSCVATSPRRGTCICGHPEPRRRRAEQGMTVGSIICDLDERRLYACAGPPCQADYESSPWTEGDDPSGTRRRSNRSCRTIESGRRTDTFEMPGCQWCATWASCAA